MTIPLEGVGGGYDNTYIFYLCQLRIAIEKAIIMFVHRCTILCAPLNISLPKVAPLVESLIRLHGFCIGENELDGFVAQSKNYDNLC